MAAACCVSKVYGLFLDGLASYSIPEGGTIAAPGFPIVYLNDSTYDGYHERRWELSCSRSVTVQILSCSPRPWCLVSQTLLHACRMLQDAG